MLNVSDISKRLERVFREQERLENYRDLSREEFQNDPDIQRAAAYAFMIAAQACMDIAAHIIANSTMRKPKDNKDLFRVLAEHSIITQPLAQNLGGMAGFRNVLAHEYLDVDQGIVYENLQHDLADLTQFQRAIIAWLEAQSP